MIRSLVFVCILDMIAASSALGSRTQKNYADSAAFIMPLEVEALNEELSDINESVMPHDVKAVRRRIGQVRGMLDFFVYAYSASEWEVMRENLDRGYDFFGQFKDLYDLLGVEKEDVNNEDYYLPDLINRRIRVLEWIDEFYRVFYKSQYVLKLRETKPGPYRVKSKRSLPKYYWQVIDYVPVNNFSLGENLVITTRELMIKTFDMMKKLKTINNIFNKKQQTEFHEIRKKVRSIIKLSKYFNTHFIESLFESEEYLLVSEFVSRMGAINDRFIALHYYERLIEIVEEEEKLVYEEKINRQHQLILQMWPELVNWYQQANVEGMFLALKDKYDYSTLRPRS